MLKFLSYILETARNPRICVDLMNK